MAEDETKPPPTYAELLEQNGALLAENAGLKAKADRLAAAVLHRDAEINARRRAKPKPRKLDPEAASPFDRPWNGR